MYCSKCGYQLSDSDNFCPKCGNKVGSSSGNNPKMIHLKCQDCNGILEIDETHEIATCPYCGSKNLIPESDNIKIERMRTNAYKDVELGKTTEETKRNIFELAILAVLIIIFFLMK